MGGRMLESVSPFIKQAHRIIEFTSGNTNLSGQFVERKKMLAPVVKQFDSAIDSIHAQTSFQFDSALPRSLQAANGTKHQSTNSTQRGGIHR